MKKFISSCLAVLVSVVFFTCEKTDQLIVLSEDGDEQVSEARAIKLPRTLGFPTSSIIYYDAADLDVQGFAFKEEPGPLEITDFGPVGELFLS